MESTQRKSFVLSFKPKKEISGFDLLCSSLPLR